MGAVVAATYALNDDWYRALRDAAADGLPAVPSYVRGADDGIRGARAVLSLGRLLRDLTLHWGTAERAQEDARRMVRELTCGGLLEAGRVPVAICTTDLRAGKRVVLRTGPAADAAFASAALAGVVPPLRRGGHLLVDGAYTDVAPVDVARSFGHPLVIAVDVRQPSATADPRNGLQALVRAMEICYARHAELRFAEADMVLRPAFGRTIDTLDFGAGRECMAAGLRAVRAQRGRLEHALGTSSLTCTGSAQPAPAL